MQPIAPVFTRNVIAWSLTLCLAWYSLSVINNLIAKALFDKFQYPLTLAFVQSASLWVLLEIVFLVRPIDDAPSIVHGRGLWRRLFPLAAGKFVATVASHVALWRVPVSFVHTIKASLPIFTCAFGRVLLGERQTYSVYFSLFVICFGVLSTTLTEIAFDVIGFTFALVSTMLFSLLAIFSKKQMIESKINQLVLLKMYGRLCTLCFLPVWVIVDGFAILNDKSIMNDEKTIRECLFFLITNGFLSSIQNIVAFSMLYVVTPLTYSVASNMKRIFVIGISIMVFNNPVVLMNFIGSLIAVFGTLLYGRARRQQLIGERRPSKHKPLLLHAPRGRTSPVLLENGNVVKSPYSPTTQNLSHTGELFFSPSEIDLSSLVPSYNMTAANSERDVERFPSVDQHKSVSNGGFIQQQYSNGKNSNIDVAPRRLATASDEESQARSRSNFHQVSDRLLQHRHSGSSATPSTHANGGVELGFGGSKVHIV